MRTVRKISKKCLAIFADKEDTSISLYSHVYMLSMLVKGSFGVQKHLYCLLSVMAQIIFVSNNIEWIKLCTQVPCIQGMCGGGHLLSTNAPGLASNMHTIGRDVRVCKEAVHGKVHTPYDWEISPQLQSFQAISASSFISLKGLGSFCFFSPCCNSAVGFLI